MLRSPGRGAVAFAAAFTLALAGAGSAQAATYNVDTVEDQVDGVIDGVCKTGLSEKCTLRAALNEANETPEADTIVLPAGIYRFQQPIEAIITGDNTGYEGDLDVLEAGGAVTIEGAGVKRTIISADGVDRVFDIQSGGSLTLDGVTVRDGHATPVGPEEWPGDTRFAEPAFTSAEIGELADRLPAGVSFLDPCGCAGDMGNGAGVRVLEDADLTVVDSAISHGSATIGLGGGIANEGGLVSVDTSKIHRNSALLAGGGIANDGGLTIEDSTVSDNVTILGGGGLFNTGDFDIVDSTFNGNLSTIFGGAIATQGQFAIPSLAALAADELEGSHTIQNSTFSDNAVRFGPGGAIASSSDFLTIDSSTFADNSGVNLDLLRLIEGGVQGPDDLFRATGNRGGAIYAAEAGFLSGQIEFSNTIVADNTDQGAQDNCVADAQEAVLFRSNGHNIDSGESCGFVSQELDGEGTDLENTDPKLDDLRDNGGPTYTRALFDDSPAIDAGGPALVSTSGGPELVPQGVPADEVDIAPELDQRGGNRPEPAGSPGEARDIGAYEANSLADLSVDSLTDAPDAVVVGKPLHLNVVVRNAGPDVIKGVDLAAQLPAGTIAAKPAQCSASGADCDLGDLAPGQTATLETIVTPADAGTGTTIATISAPGITDTDPSNDSRTTTTAIEAAPAQQQQEQQPTQLPPTGTPPQPIDDTPVDKDIDLNVKVPNTVTVNQFFAGITVEADCGDEACLRKFREHAAINTGATRIAGFNLTVSRTSLGFNTKKKRVKLQPCKSGSTNGRRHRRCLRNLRKAAKKAAPFRVKVVVAAVDKAGNRTAQKAFITVK